MWDKVRGSCRGGVSSESVGINYGEIKMSTTLYAWRWGRSGSQNLNAGWGRQRKGL